MSFIPLEALTLVIDIGKSHAKLILINDAGVVVEKFSRDNQSVKSPLGYPALDLWGLELWMATTLRECPYTARCTRVITTTHGAAFVGLSDLAEMLSTQDWDADTMNLALAWWPLDYEFDCDVTYYGRVDADPYDDFAAVDSVTATDRAHDAVPTVSAAPTSTRSQFLRVMLDHYQQFYLPARAAKNTDTSARSTSRSHSARDANRLSYEFNIEPRTEPRSESLAAVFRETFSPNLPAGLNAAQQLFYVLENFPEAWRTTQTLLPYPQYWAWRLSGQYANERTSLGCHTHLWNPCADIFSSLAVGQGWDSLFPEMRFAWDDLGSVTPAIQAAWGLPENCRVLVGVHDSNACLARYLFNDVASATELARHAPAKLVKQESRALTVVSSGTWTILMAPGAPIHCLDEQRDMLCNVDVLARATPTARFMGGREFAALLGARPAAIEPDSIDLSWALSVVERFIDAGVFVLPSFSPHGGPFAGRQGRIKWGRWQAVSTNAISETAKTSVFQDLSENLSENLNKDLSKELSAELDWYLSPAQRASLAALYCALMTAYLQRALWGGSSGDALAGGEAANQCDHLVVIEGPLSKNPLYVALLQTLLPNARCEISVDELEGTARGAWCLAQWGAGRHDSDLGLGVTPRVAEPAQAQKIAAYYQEWLRLL